MAKLLIPKNIKKRGLLLPRQPFFGADSGQSPPSEVGLFVPPEAIYPELEATEETLIALLASLSRDDTLFHCARTNTIVSGPGNFDPKARQQQAVTKLCTSEEI